MVITSCLVDLWLTQDEPKAHHATKAELAGLRRLRCCLSGMGMIALLLFTFACAERFFRFLAKRTGENQHPR
jgi:hypothetical protein